MAVELRGWMRGLLSECADLSGFVARSKHLSGFRAISKHVSGFVARYQHLSGFGARSKYLSGFVVTSKHLRGFRCVLEGQDYHRQSWPTHFPCVLLADLQLLPILLLNPCTLSDILLPQPQSRSGPGHRRTEETMRTLTTLRNTTSANPRVCETFSGRYGSGTYNSRSPTLCFTSRNQL